MKYFAVDPQFRGGWEIWLQCTIGYAFLPANGTMSREVPYPSGVAAAPYLNAAGAAVVLPAAAARADFTISRPAGIADTTYLELKCRSSQETLDQSWARYWSDVAKLKTLLNANIVLNGSALFGTFGTFSEADLKNILSRSEMASAHVLDFGPGTGQPPLHTLLSNVAKGGANRFFLVGTSAG